MEKKINILIVEDEAILAMALSDKLESEGYNVVGIANNGTKAIQLFETNNVDLLLCDINIQGDFDGIDTVKKIVTIRAIPAIYLTAFSDNDTIERAKSTYPAAYITKPYNLTNLRISIEVAISNFAFLRNPETKIIQNGLEKDKPYIIQIDDYIFIKQGYQFMKVYQYEIYYLEADDSYTTFITKQKKYALRMSLAAVLTKLDTFSLIRTHRSFAVNIKKIDAFNDYEINIENFIIPLAKNYKDNFMRFFVLK